jgi:intermediate peptidase
MEFLTSLKTAVQPRLDAKASMIRQGAIQQGYPHSLMEWDRLFFEGKIKDTSVKSNLKMSVGQVFENLSDIYSQLYGIRLEPATDMSLSEIWHPDVRKLHVIHETEGRIGDIYCDLFDREGATNKFDGAAHFTVRCSRRLDWDEKDPLHEQLLPTRFVEEGQNSHQLPIIVLVTQFQSPEKGPCYLDLSDIKTLFHEMGHAIHCKHLLLLLMISNAR